MKAAQATEFGDLEVQRSGGLPPLTAETGATHERLENNRHGDISKNDNANFVILSEAKNLLFIGCKKQILRPSASE